MLSWGGFIKKYYNFESSVPARSFFTTNGHHAENLPSISTLRYLMKKFEQAGDAKYSRKDKNRTLKKRR